jgi:4-carboxymuconolactone decarboxylase
MSETRFPTLTAEQMTDEQCAASMPSNPAHVGPACEDRSTRYCAVLCDLVQRLGAYVRFGSSIPVPLNELAICMAGRKWGSRYEFYQHRRVGIQAGLS